jgi:predicted NUDIX family phosphoesterase
MSEKILVVPTARFHELGVFQGFLSDHDKYFAGLLDPVQLQFQPRADMETDPNFKQLIPYLILLVRSPEGQVQVFHYRRGPAGDEKRLTKKRSIGIGGHISEEDAQGSDQPFETGMARELAEEVSIGCSFFQRRFGILNDDSNDVGKVHLGLVHLLFLDRAAVRPNEDHISETGFTPLTELLTQLDEFENWSQICLQQLQTELSGMPG